MKFFQYLAQGDVIFIKALNRTHADRIQEVKFGIPANLLKVTEITEKDLPKGESWIEE